MNQAIVQEGEKLLKELTPILKEQWGKAWNWLKEQAKDLDWEKVFDNLKHGIEDALDSGMPDNVKTVCVEKDLLKKDDLVKIARENIVAGSNQVLAAINTKQKSAYYVYLAYACNREMIPQEENTYVIIKAEALAKDVENLFGGKELIILK